MTGKRPERERVQLRISVDAYRSIEAAAKTSGEEAALKAALERGMESYWSHYFEDITKDLDYTRKKYEECVHDNKLLRGLTKQNVELSRLLSERGEDAR